MRRIYVKGEKTDENDRAPEGYKSVRVETGVYNDQYIEIKSGLSEGDVVYTPQIQAAVQSGAPMGGMMGAMHSSAMNGMMGGGMGGGRMPSGGMGGGMPSGGMGGNRQGGGMPGGMR